MRKWTWITIGLVIIGVLVLFGLIQLIPYGHNHNNPPVIAEPNWDSQQTRALAVRACFDCHSNETTWPWYSNIAPISWLVERDVEEGRQRLNFSEWGVGRQRTREIVEVVQRGSMPPGIYIIQHPSAKLTSQETQQLIQGLQATFGGGGQ